MEEDSLNLQSFILHYSFCIVHSQCEALVGSPYPEVTDAVLPSSLKRVLSYALGYSPYPPVSVSVRIFCILARGFSSQIKSAKLFHPEGIHSHSQLEVYRRTE